MSTPFADHEIEYISSRDRAIEGTPGGVAANVVRRHKNGQLSFQDEQGAKYIVWTEGDFGIGVVSVGNDLRIQYEGDADVPENPLGLISSKPAD